MMGEIFERLKAFSIKFVFLYIFIFFVVVPTLKYCEKNSKTIVLTKKNIKLKRGNDKNKIFLVKLVLISLKILQFVAWENNFAIAEKPMF
jgi:hypothetical protein